MDAGILAPGAKTGIIRVVNTVTGQRAGKRVEHTQICANTLTICVSSNQIILLEAFSPGSSLILKIDLEFLLSKQQTIVCVTAQNHNTHKLKKQEKKLPDKNLHR